jgi:7-cyano-7-deazaguanine reductase
MTQDLAKNLKSLGSEGTTYTYSGADATLLEHFPNPAHVQNESNAEQVVSIRAPEFTSLCPKTGQPDFATIAVRYQADKCCVESKSFKLYLGSFRNHGEFHEACVQRICDDLVALLDPKWLEVTGEFTPRGGISFWPTSMYSKGD